VTLSRQVWVNSICQISVAAYPFRGISRNLLYVMIGEQLAPTVSA